LHSKIKDIFFKEIFINFIYFKNLIPPPLQHTQPEAKFLDVIGTIVLKEFDPLLFTVTSN
jgi:hypothetical protein